MTAAPRKQHFTVAEANRRLPLVRAVVQDIVRLYGDVRERKERLDRLRSGRKRDGHDPHGEELEQVEEELQKDVGRLQAYVAELNELGAELKDPERGLIDFRSMMDGREVYLCWLLGEEEIGWWHELHAGFAGRQSLLEGSIPGAGTGEESE